MIYKNNLKLIFVSILLIFTVIGCSDSSTSADESVAIIQGSVEEEASKAKTTASQTGTEGSVVIAARVTSNGSFEAISETETEVSTSGEFTLEVDASAADRIAVIAETGGGTLKGYVAANIENGQSYTIKPVDVESTAETRVYGQLVADGKANVVHSSDIEAAVNANAAAEIYTSSSAIAQVAAGLANSAEARAEFISEFEGDAETRLNQYFEAMTDVQLQLESNLAASSSAGEREAAYDAFLDAKLNAYTETGVDVSTLAKLGHLKVNVMQNSFTTVSSSVRNNVKASTSLFAAIAIDKAVQASAEASGVSQATLSAIADAGVTLRGEVKGSAGASGGIEAAFEAYHGEVRSALESDSSVQASIIIAIDTELNSVGGAKLLFESALSGVISAGTLSEIYVEYTNSVHSTVEAQSDLLGDVNAAAIADILIFINLFS